MPDIKVKQIANKTIKTLNKEAIIVQKTKDNLVEIKDKVNNLTDNDGNNYQTDKLLTTSKGVVGSSLIKFAHALLFIYIFKSTSFSNIF